MLDRVANNIVLSYYYWPLDLVYEVGWRNGEPQKTKAKTCQAHN